jgi:hypothetical protein
MLWTGFIWFSAGSSGKSLRTYYCTFGFHERREFLNHVSSCKFLKKDCVHWEKVFRKLKSSGDYGTNLFCYDHEYKSVQVYDIRNL